MIQTFCLHQLKDEDGELTGETIENLLKFSQNEVLDLYTFDTA